MKFGISYNLVVPRPLDSDQWGPDDEHKLMKEVLEQVEFADKLGFDYVWETEHHFLEEYSTRRRRRSSWPAPRSAPRTCVWATASSRCRRGTTTRRASPSASPRSTSISNGRVEFGTGEGATITEIGGFGTPRDEKKEAWEEATREAVRMMTMTPYPGFEGHALQHAGAQHHPQAAAEAAPAAVGRRQPSRDRMLGARLGMGALGFGFETPEEAEERVSRYYEPDPQHAAADRRGDEPGDLDHGANMMMAPTNEEAMTRGMRGAQYFGFSLAFTNGEVRPRQGPHQPHVHGEVRREGDEKPIVAVAEPEDETQRTLFRAGRRGLLHRLTGVRAREPAPLRGVRMST